MCVCVCVCVSHRLLSHDDTVESLSWDVYNQLVQEVLQYKVCNTSLYVASMNVPIRPAWPCDTSAVLAFTGSVPKRISVAHVEDD